MQPYAKIITEGLGDHACKGLLTADFSLAGCTFEVHVGGGGPYPGPAINKLAPGEIHNFYKPINPDNQPWLTRDQFDVVNKRPVTIKVHIGQRTFEHNVLVPDEKAKFTVSVLNIAKIMRDDVKILMSKIRHQIDNATISIKNLSNKDK